MGLTPSKYPPKKKKMLRFTIVAKHRVLNFTKSGLNRVAMARHGLILWENDATGLKIIFLI